jgi:heat shock protein HslJ
MNTRNLSIALTIAVTMLTACSPSGEQTDGASLEGTQWVLLELNGRPPLADAPATADFSESEIGGTTGCNHYFGSYRASGSDLTISEVGMTEMYCMEPAGVMEQEQEFLTALGTVAGYRLAADRLEMLDAAGDVVLAFAPPAPLPEVTLEDTEWALTAFTEGEAATSLISGTAINLRFEGGRVSGSAGCNGYAGLYSLGPGALRITDIAITERGCLEPAGIMEQEATYVDILRSVTVFELHADRLTLRTADGRGLAFAAP